MLDNKTIDERTDDIIIGNTEDTDVNQMRWNVKFEEKRYRIDGIFVTKGAFNILEAKRIGLEPIEIDANMQRMFELYRIPNVPNREELIKKHNGKLKLWPSDHFGVMAKLELIE